MRALAVLVTTVDGEEVCLIDSWHREALNERLRTLKLAFPESKAELVEVDVRRAERPTEPCPPPEGHDD